jgi:CxxC motif-containing protein
MTMPEKKELICIVCPKGCRLSLEEDPGNALGFRVTGLTCKRGETYAVKEVTAPTRMLTSTVRIHGARLNRLPVRTSSDIPREKVLDCMQLINELEVQSPVKMGQILVPGLFGTEANLIASRSL